MTFEQFVIISTFTTLKHKWDDLYSFDPPAPSTKMYKTILANIRSNFSFRIMNLHIIEFIYKSKSNVFLVRPESTNDMVSMHIDPETLEVRQ